jgi:cysteine-rich repeat protein
MRRTRSLTALVVTTTLLAIAAGAHAVDLANGKRVTLRDKANPKQDSLSFTYRQDPGLFSLVDPTCGSGNQTTLQIVTSAQIGPEVTLPCANWKVTGTGYRYAAKAGNAGGVRAIGFKAGSLVLRAAGPPYAALGGPAAWVETRFRVGSTLYCGRFEQPPSQFLRNQVDLVVAKGPTVPCQLTCGNGIVEPGEACDDGDLVSGDGCDANCTPTACGNGIPTAGEDCDDGNTTPGDGCRADCTLEVCGDGILDAGEDCDDGNVTGGDCCSAVCGAEAAGSACMDDGNLCTDDECDGAGACTHPANSAPCNDHDGCTTNDVCSGGTCSGTLLAPWVNEFDYDDNAVPLNGDRDEFIEIAGPAGTDLGGYQIASVEGAGPGCLGTGSVGAGFANVLATVPPGTVLGDDTGTGIGFFVACFANTSTNVSAVGGCDVVLPAPFTDTNLQNGHLTNTDESSCPDGILVLDADDNLIDAISYEGVVANAGPYGPFFHVTPPYVAPRDEGWLLRVSIEKTTSTLARALAASEWRDPSELGAFLCSGQIGFTCPTNTATPGAENPLQSLACGSPCAAFLDEGASLIE